MKKLRGIRIVVSGLVFAAILLLFLGIKPGVIQGFAQGLTQFQLFPALLYFTVSFSGVSILGFFGILLLTFVFGRIYCSSLCPMGAFQDVVWRLGNIFRKKKNRRFVYSPSSRRYLRYGILAATLLLWLSGSLFLLNLLDPYSNFGKISVSFFQPAYIWINNQLTFFLERFHIYTLTPLELKVLPVKVLAVSGGIFLSIVLMTLWRGRLFCNTLCPAGALLGLMSEKPLMGIQFNAEACNFCRKCERRCKAGCLDSKTHKVDMSRCVACFNCLDACEQNGITYGRLKNNALSFGKKKEDESVDAPKRNFLLMMGVGLLSIPLVRKRTLAQVQGGAGSIPSGSKHPVTPPGSIGHEHFTSKCIACYLCVSACPSHVIVPSFFDYGMEGFMQPRLDYHVSFCNFDCTRCGEVCPTGAILPLLMEEKQVEQLGIARFLPESCVVVVNGTDCGACSEHCPTKAVEMVPYGSLFIPKVHPDICIGCGACEYACPTMPYKAIYVESHLEHKKALPIIPPEDTQPQKAPEATDDFPF